MVGELFRARFMTHSPNNTHCSHDSFGPQRAFHTSEMVGSCLTVHVQYKMAPNQNSQQWHNRTTLPNSLWCMDVCSVHNNQELQGSVNALSPRGQSSKATQNNYSYLCFVLHFLLPVKTQLADCKCYIDAICRQCQEDGAAVPTILGV